MKQHQAPKTQGKGRGIFEILLCGQPGVPMETCVTKSIVWLLLLFLAFATFVVLNKSCMNQSLWSLSGQYALVTGGTKGIGEAIVRQFLDLGAAVFIVARDNELLQKQLVDYRQQGHTVAGLAADISQPDVATQVIEAVQAT